MDLTPYEGKKVRLTVTYEGMLERRSAGFPVYSHRIFADDGSASRLKPADVMSVKLAEPEWWPPLPGDVLHFRNDRPEIVYTVSTDGKTLLSNNSGTRANSYSVPHTVSTDGKTLLSNNSGTRANSYSVPLITPGPPYVCDPNGWTLLHKGAARQVKEGK